MCADLGAYIERIDEFFEELQARLLSHSDRSPKCTRGVAVTCSHCREPAAVRRCSNTRSLAVLVLQRQTGEHDAVDVLGKLGSTATLLWTSARKLGTGSFGSEMIFRPRERS